MRILYKVLFWILLGSYVAALLLQRAFPTQDGPVHLYYADVLRHLISGDASYRTYFAVKHWVPPYAFHYYLIILLMEVLTPLQAEKLLVASYVVAFCLAFRYLVRGFASTGKNADAWALLAFPFVANRTLYLGFYNFSFGVAVAIFLAGYWLRHYRELVGKRLAAALLLVFTLAMTHPVALFVALLVMGGHVAMAAAGEYRSGTGAARERTLAAWRRLRRPAIVVGAAGLASAAWILQFRFTDGGGLYWIVSPLRPLALLAMAPLTPFRSVAYRLLLAVPAAVAFLAAAAHLRRRRPALGSAPYTLAAMTAVCVLLYIGTPFEVNHGAFFPDRFPIFAVAFLAALAAGFTLRPRTERALALGLAAISVVCLAWQVAARHRIVGELAALYDAPAQPSDHKVVIVASEPINNRSAGPYAFNPYMWAGLHLVRRSRAVFLNSAWLDTPIAMLEARHEHRCIYQDPFETAACLTGRDVPDAPRPRGGPPPSPDLLIAVEGSRQDPDFISTSGLARSMGLEPTPLRAAMLHLYARR